MRKQDYAEIVRKYASEREESREHIACFRRQNLPQLPASLQDLPGVNSCLTALADNYCGTLGVYTIRGECPIVSELDKRPGRGHSGAEWEEERSYEKSSHR
jgi:hypothetical protein